MHFSHLAIITALAAGLAAAAPAIIPGHAEGLSAQNRMVAGDDIITVGLTTSKDNDKTYQVTIKTQHECCLKGHPAGFFKCYKSNKWTE
ncbi:uncharacterized protein DSM5745_03593 [Aspergillus mulundensis]|uniref:Uncharacterized protein n=1 Tax=Aspergillus mulundensis TaxID=1810919 RepID=A0A3D8SL86_9EURO|nr:hypothetical protein DSM5745_03593 [Aspergillus mulundensis]RDW86951.1 hypothetical protein DSM5745_03593 [Aspergillus mulundensis]